MVGVEGQQFRCGHTARHLPLLRIQELGALRLVQAAERLPQLKQELDRFERRLLQVVGREVGLFGLGHAFQAQVPDREHALDVLDGGQHARQPQKLPGRVGGHQPAHVLDQVAPDPFDQDNEGRLVDDERNPRQLPVDLRLHVAAGVDERRHVVAGGQLADQDDAGHPRLVLPANAVPDQIQQAAPLQGGSLLFLPTTLVGPVGALLHGHTRLAVTIDRTSYYVARVSAFVV